MLQQCYPQHEMHAALQLGALQTQTRRLFCIFSRKSAWKRGNKQTSKSSEPVASPQLPLCRQICPRLVPRIVRSFFSFHSRSAVSPRPRAPSAHERQPLAIGLTRCGAALLQFAEQLGSGGAFLTNARSVHGARRDDWRREIA